MPATSRRPLEPDRPELVPAWVRVRQLRLTDYEVWVTLRALEALIQYREYHVGQQRKGDRRDPKRRTTPRSSGAVVEEFLPRDSWLRKVKMLELVHALARESGITFESRWNPRVHGVWPGIDRYAVFAYAQTLFDEHQHEGWPT